MEDTTTVTAPVPERVAKGVEALTAYDPGWYSEINLDTLDMASGFTCVAAQVAGKYDEDEDGRSYNDYSTGLDVLDIDEGGPYGFEAVVYPWGGSEVEPFEAWQARRDGDYAALDAEWRRVITELRAQG